MKRCSRCELNKLESEFSKRSKAFDGLQNCCKQCKSLYAKGIKKFLPIKDQSKKPCKSCQSIKNITEFFKSKSSYDGLSGYCKICTSKRNRKYEQNQAKKKIYKCYFCSVILLKYNKCCSTCRGIKIEERKQTTYRDRKTDILYKLRSNISRAIRSALKANNSSKSGKSILKYLTYTFQELKIHLENQFSYTDNLTPDGKIWMNWNNHGTHSKYTWNENNPSTWRWHIDHIIPQSKLIYNSMTHSNFKICWSLDNLMPLCARKNIQKRDKIIY